MTVWGSQGVTDRLTQGGWTLDTAESSRAEALLATQFDVLGPQLVVRADAPESVDAPAAAAAGKQLCRRLALDPQVDQVTCYWHINDPELRSRDGRSAASLVHLRGNERTVGKAARDVEDRFSDRAGPLQVSMSGKALVLSETERLSTQSLHRAELMAVPLVLIILLWVLGSLPAALLPVAVGAFTASATAGFLRVLSEHVTVSAFALNITTVLGFGLAVDYCLLLVQRYRDELTPGRRPGHALRRTLHTAGRTVGYSAAALTACMSSMLLFPQPLLRSVAYGGIAVVCASAVTTFTVLPALLIVLGRQLDRFDVFAPFRRPLLDPARGVWFRLAQRVMRRPAAVTGGVLILLMLLAAPAVDVRLGMYDERILPASAPVAQVTKGIRADFDTGMMDRANVVMPRFRADHETETALDAYARRLSRVPQVQRVKAATGTYRDGLLLAPPGRSAAQFTGRGGTWLSVVAEPGHNPSSPQGSILADNLRAVPAPAPALVGGAGAALADVERSLAARLPWALALICAATLLLLTFFSRSLVLPLKALLLNALSLTAASGIVVFVFQQGHLLFLLGDASATGVTDVIIPSLMFCLAFGLSMDYEVFLLARIVEEHRRGSPTPLAVALGLQHTGRLFTSAALVFITVAASLALSPLLPLKVFGVGLALAVLLDCTVVRALLVPAVVKLFGDANWWVPAPSARSRRQPARHSVPTALVPAKDLSVMSSDTVSVATAAEPVRTRKDPAVE
ncbi:MMPL family transporter [Streptomyces sp. NPDC006627]|uniref:MMPL family transporter n=1 Tax=Streptomyces sp. NPDC006627 TaxID=3154679 RepID=UPI0033A5253D